MLLSVDKLGLVAMGTPRLSEVSFSLNGGDRLAVLGVAGAGKSLLLGALAGRVPRGGALSGSVIFGADSKVGPDLGKRVGALAARAEKSFDPLRAVGPQLGASANAILAEAEIDAARATQFPAAFTTGELRLIALARELASKPDLLLLDDPSSDLDLLAQRRIVDLVRKHTSERGMALVLATPDLKLAALLATRALVLQAGRVVESGTAGDVFGRPRHEVTRRLMTAGRPRAKTLMRAPIGGPLLDVRKVGLTIKRPDVSIVQPRPPLVVLDDISFSLRVGESLAFTGPSGAGKSALLRVIAGLADATAGELEIDRQTYHGSDIPTPLRREIGVVFTDPARSFNPRLSVGESIAEPLRLESLKPMDELSDRIIEMVRAVGFAPEIMVRPPSDFTTGQLQRLALARALMTRPRVILLDDPFRHLDVLARGEMLAMLSRLRADFGLTLITVAHDLETLKQLADRVLVLDKGKIVETATPAMLLEKPQQPLTQQLVAAALPDVSIVPVF